MRTIVHPATPMVAPTALYLPVGAPQRDAPLDRSGRAGGRGRRLVDLEDEPHVGAEGVTLGAPAVDQRLDQLESAPVDAQRIRVGVAAVALRSLIFGASRPELGMTAVLDAEQIADIVLGGVLRRDS